MTRAGPGDDRTNVRTLDVDETDGRSRETPLKCRRLANPRLRRLVLARIDALLAARMDKAG